VELLAKFGPYVDAHLAAAPGNRVSFAGHSLGGSLATVLMLLLVYRRSVAPAQVAGVHTYGAPAVFCNASAPGGADGAGGGGGGFAATYLAAAPGFERVAAADGLLAALGLPEAAIHNVIMHRDIVPRAFVCDYTAVSDMLQRWVPSFKGHTGACSPARAPLLFAAFHVSFLLHFCVCVSSATPSPLLTPLRPAPSP
jgi:acetyl esterase/lipase